MWSGIEQNDEYFRRMDTYWHQVNESEGFDIEGIMGPPGMDGLIPVSCLGLESLGYAFRPLVNRYAKLGLLRYNRKEGTNFELHCLIKFNTRSSGASSFFMTLAARDTVTRRPMQTFQVRVDETRCGILDAICSIARLKGETTREPFSPHYDDDLLPHWPSDAFDGQRFYLVEGSELPDTHWIHLYLELAVYKYDWNISDEDLSKLKIVKVAIDTTEEVPLKAQNSVLYIAFKGLASGGIGENVERKAIIKSGVSERTGFLYLKGHLCRGEEEDQTPMSLKEICNRNRELYLQSRTTD